MVTGSNVQVDEEAEVETPALESLSSPRISARRGPQTELEFTATADVVTVSLEVELTKGECTSSSMLAEVSPESSASRSFCSMSGPIIGVVHSAGGTAVDFHVGESRALKHLQSRQKSKNDDETNYLISAMDGAKRQKVTLVDTESQIATVVRISDGWQASLEVECRKATEIEIKRQKGSRQLIKATNGSKYSYLNGQIVRAKASHVEMALIEKAVAKLKTLQVSAPDVSKLKKALKWDKTTTGASDYIPTEECTIDGCVIGAPRVGEVLDIEGGGIELALAGCAKAQKAIGNGSGTAADEWLFKQIAKAVFKTAKEGAVWRTGK